MWITTCHRFTNRAEFLAVCQAAGWTCLSGQDPELPHGVAMDIVGPVLGPPRVGADGMPIAGAIIDPRYHVNLAWHAQEMHPAFELSQIAPATPSRTFGLALALPSAPAVPATIPAWKGKAVLREAGLLNEVEAAVAAAGGLVQDAWEGAFSWDRSSRLVTELSKQLGLSSPQIDQMFRDADIISV